MWTRSIIFYATFYSWTLVFCTLVLPALFFPRLYLIKSAKIWSGGVLWLCKHVLNLYVQINGENNLKVYPAIIASKHQSAWETIFLQHLIPDATIVLKKELFWIPLIGLYLKKLGMIGLSRTKGKSLSDLKILLHDAQFSLTHSGQVLIFPEGTRSTPGKATKYQSGVASLYLHLKVPVIPIAHNAGIFWPRRGFLKHPGTITVDILPPIQPGLSRKEFMGILENKIETASNKLVRKGYSYVAKT